MIKLWRDGLHLVLCMNPKKLYLSCKKFMLDVSSVREDLSPGIETNKLS